MEPRPRAYIIDDSGEEEEEDANRKRRLAAAAATTLAEIQKTLGDTKAILGAAIGGLAIRGERLRNLLNLTNILGQSAGTFRERSVQLNQEIYLQRLKLFICCTLYAFATLVALSYLTSTETWTATLEAAGAIPRNDSTTQSA